MVWMVCFWGSKFSIKAVRLEGHPTKLIGSMDPPRIPHPTEGGVFSSRLVHWGTSWVYMCKKHDIYILYPIGSMGLVYLPTFS